MAEGPYRDALAAVRERALLLEADVERLSARVSPLDLALCPEEVALRTDALRTRLASQPEPTLAAWTERERVLEALIAALREAEALAPVLELAPEAPLPRDSSSPRPFLMEERRHQRLTGQVAAELDGHARHVRCTRWSDDAYVWSFELERIALSLYGRPFIGALGEELNILLMLYAAMPTEVGRIEVAPAHWWARTSSEIDPDFARRFRVAGPTRQARALLGAELRAGLVAMHARSPRLQIAEGVATLAWRMEDVAFDEPTFHVLEAARALVALRHALG